MIKKNPIIVWKIAPYTFGNISLHQHAMKDILWQKHVHNQVNTKSTKVHT